jgi:hypothetical protein
MTKTNATTNVALAAAKRIAEKADAKKTAPAKKLSKEDADKITSSRSAIGNAEVHVVDAAGGQSLTMPTAMWTGTLRKLSQVGQSFATFKAAHDAKLAEKPKAQLARGVNSNHAPHSAKAVSDSNGKATNKADKVVAKAKVKAQAKEKVEARKSERQSWTQNLSYKWTGENNARPGTWRHAMLDTASKNTTTDAGNKAMTKNREFGSRKIDWRWLAAQGYIKLV